MTTETPCPPSGSRSPTTAAQPTRSTATTSPERGDSGNGSETGRRARSTSAATTTASIGETGATDGEPRDTSEELPITDVGRSPERLPGQSVSVQQPSLAALRSDLRLRRSRIRPIAPTGHAGTMRTTQSPRFPGQLRVLLEEAFLWEHVPLSKGQMSCATSRVVAPAQGAPSSAANAPVLASGKPASPGWASSCLRARLLGASQRWASGTKFRKLL